MVYANKNKKEKKASLGLYFRYLVIIAILIDLIYISINSTNVIQSISSILGLIAFGIILLLGKFKEVIIKASEIRIKK